MSFDAPLKVETTAAMRPPEAAHEHTRTYWLTRVFVLRGLSMIYFIAFLVAYEQNGALIGDEGLTPANSFLERARQHLQGDVCLHGSWCVPKRLVEVPTLFWYVEPSAWALDAAALTGCALSLLVVLGFADNALSFLSLWVLQQSICNVGQMWYAFAWESLLLEVGFIAIFLAPVRSRSAFDPRCPPSRVCMWLLRWLSFRIMLGAGLIKLRAGRCWLDFTCMYYFYETQPVPSPVSWLMHQSPLAWHRVEVLVNHAVELGICWLILLPWRPAQLVAGVCIITFQLLLIMTGNLSFLNWLTILPTIAALDDAFLSWLTRPLDWAAWARRARRAQSTWSSTRLGVSQSLCRAMSLLCHLALAMTLCYLSVPVLSNMLSDSQGMNIGFDKLHIVNSYGAFGRVGHNKYQIVISASYDNDGMAENTRWLEFQFKCLPGKLEGTPCIITPYLYRLDWVAQHGVKTPQHFQSFASHPWLVLLMAKLLAGDTNTLHLMHRDNSHVYNHSKGQALPALIKADIYEYSFTKLRQTANQPDGRMDSWLDSWLVESGWPLRWPRNYWNRSLVKNFVPPFALGNPNVERFLHSQGWSMPRVHPQKTETRKKKKQKTGKKKKKQEL